MKRAMEAAPILSRTPQLLHSDFERLLVAEGEQRRVRIELHEPAEQTAAVVAIADYKKDLGTAE